VPFSAGAIYEENPTISYIPVEGEKYATQLFSPMPVKYRDGWFYIDETDYATKRFFRLMGTFWSVAIAESAAQGSAAPVLTVPVSR
jgi:hypothetical protein